MLYPDGDCVTTGINGYPATGKYVKINRVMANDSNPNKKLLLSAIIKLRFAISASKGEWQFGNGGEFIVSKDSEEEDE